MPRTSSSRMQSVAGYVPWLSAEVHARPCRIQPNPGTRIRTGWWSPAPRWRVHRYSWIVACAFVLLCRSRVSNIDCRRSMRSENHCVADGHSSVTGSRGHALWIIWSGWMSTIVWHIGSPVVVGLGLKSEPPPWWRFDLLSGAPASRSTNLLSEPQQMWRFRCLKRQRLGIKKAQLSTGIRL